MPEELSLEQQLVLQLSAAINHEEDNNSSNNNTSASNQNGSQATDNAELASLFSQIGQLTGSSEPELKPNTTSNVPQSLLPPPPQPTASKPAQANGEQSISTDALISSLLYPNSGGISLSNINLNNINLKEISLDTLTYISNTLGSNAAKQASSIGSNYTKHKQNIINPPSQPQPKKRSQSFLDQAKLSSEIQAALNDSRLQTVPMPTPQQQQTIPSQPPATAPKSSGLDSDVSTIQNVLQSLFGASSDQKASTDPNTTVAGLDLSSLGLGKEDQNFIDSLKSVFDTPSDLTETKTLDDKLPSAKRARLSEPGSYDSTNRYKYQSDYTAADPDTLRAIQQALLGALHPSSSAASASVANSLAETLAQVASHEDSDSDGPEEGTSSKDAHASGTAGDDKLDEQQTADTKKKHREDAAARKRRWREVNLLQNRDNDLRSRILKRASDIYGPGESPAKSKWIDDEFERRRQRRILRAGVHAIVENARARQAKINQEELGSYQDPYGYPGQQATLAQQSRKDASSQLSQLFKNSNAALEQHLYGGKLSVPLVPYMLVPFPQRPKYRERPVPSPAPWDLMDTEDATSPSPSGTQAGVPPKPETNETKKETTEHTPKEKTNEKPEGINKPTHTEIVRPPPRYDEASDRPKHRYTLIGNLKLGVPPNLTAIYRKFHNEVKQ